MFLRYKTRKKDGKQHLFGAAYDVLLHHLKKDERMIAHARAVMEYQMSTSTNAPFLDRSWTPIPPPTSALALSCWPRPRCIG